MHYIYSMLQNCDTTWCTRPGIGAVIDRDQIRDVFPRKDPMGCKEHLQETPIFFRCKTTLKINNIL